MGNLVLGIVIVASGAIGLAVVVVLFAWGAVKDGQDNDEAQRRIHPGEPAPPKAP